MLSDSPVKTAVRTTLGAVAQPVQKEDTVEEPVMVDSQRHLRMNDSRKSAPVTLATLNDVRTMFTSLLKEYAYWVDEAWITGTIPPELCGTYYRNGPALHVSNTRYQRHTLDGDGMVFSVAFKDGKAYFRNRFVRTKGFVEEQAAGRPLHRNSFTRGAVDGSPLFNPFDLKFKNVANTGVLPWAGQLYALWEAGLPHLMDPRTLDTLRESRMGGQIRGNTFSAHYHIVTELVPRPQQHHHQPQPQPQQDHHHQQLQNVAPQQHTRSGADRAPHPQAAVPQQPSRTTRTTPPQHVGSSMTHDLHRQHGSPDSNLRMPLPMSQQHINGHAQPRTHAGHHGQAAPLPIPSAPLFGQRIEREHVSSAEGLDASTAQSSAPATSRRLVTFSNEFGFGGARAIFYEFEESGLLLHETEHKLEGLDIAMIHDMLVTEHYYVLVVGPVKLDPIKFGTRYLLGGCSIAECLVFDEHQPARIMFFPRPGRPSKKVLSPRILTADPFFAFHNVNGFEVPGQGEGNRDGDGVVVLDTVAWDEVTFDLTLFAKEAQRAHLDGFVGGERAQLTRLVCDLRTGRVERHKLLQRTVEFPATDPRVVSRPHRVAWFITDAIDDPVLWGPAQAVLRVELDPSIGLAASHRRGLATSAATAGIAAQDRRRPQALQLAPPRPAAGAARGAVAGAAPGVAVDQWYFGERVFPGEPMFVPRPGSDREGDGWLIIAVHDASTEKGSIHIFDAENLSAGPLASMHLPHRLPLSLHGAWDGQYNGPDPHDAAVPRWHEVGTVRAL